VDRVGDIDEFLDDEPLAPRGSAPEDLDADHDEVDDDDDRSVKSGARDITPWEEAIGIIVAANMEARARSPKGSGGPSRGRGGRGQGGGRGGRGRGRSDRGGQRGGSERGSAERGSSDRESSGRDDSHPSDEGPSSWADDVSGA
jgi:hypothetical protein